MGGRSLPSEKHGWSPTFISRERKWGLERPGHLIRSWKLKIKGGLEPLIWLPMDSPSCPHNLPPPHPCSIRLSASWALLKALKNQEPVRTSESRHGHPMRTGHCPFQEPALLCRRLSFAEGPRLSKAALKSRRRSYDPRPHFGRLVNNNGRQLVSQALRGRLLTEVAFARAAN